MPKDKGKHNPLATEEKEFLKKEVPQIVVDPIKESP